MFQEKLQTMVMQKFWGVIEVYYGIVQVVNKIKINIGIKNLGAERRTKSRIRNS